MFEPYWIWWLLIAVLLVILEIFVPSALLIWFALGAICALLVSLIPEAGIWVQALVFAFTSLASVFVLRPYYRARISGGNENLLVNNHEATMVGASGVLVEAIEGGEGRARIGYSTWQVTGPELPKKTRVRVTAIEGTKLSVRADDAY